MSAVLERPRRRMKGIRLLSELDDGAPAKLPPPRLRPMPGTLPALPPMLRRAALMMQAPYQPRDGAEMAMAPTAKAVPRIAQYDRLLRRCLDEMRQSRALTRPRVERLVLHYYLAAVEVRTILESAEANGTLASITVPIPANA